MHDQVGVLFQRSVWIETGEHHTESRKSYIALADRVDDHARAVGGLEEDAVRSVDRQAEGEPILTFVHLAPLLTTRRHQETGNQF